MSIRIMPQEAIFMVCGKSNKMPNKISKAPEIWFNNFGFGK